MKRCFVVAHRCGYNEARKKENSIESLKYCNSKKYIDGIELDCQLTKDNKIVVFHDIYIKMNNRLISVDKLTFKELDSWYYIKNNIHLNTLEEMISKMSISKVMFVEIKSIFKTNNKLIKMINDVIKKYKYKKTKIMCFQSDVLCNYYKINKKEELVLLVSKTSFLYNAKLKYHMYFDKKIKTVAIHKNMVKYSRCKKLLKNHFLAIYTIKNEREIDKIINSLGDILNYYKEKIIIITTIPEIVDRRVNRRLEK